MTELVGIPVEVLTPYGLAGLAVLFVLTGLLVPRRTHNDTKHEAAEWRTEARIKDQQIAVKDEQIAVKDEQLRHMAELGETVRSVLTALQRMGPGGPS